MQSDGSNIVAIYTSGTFCDALFVPHTNYIAYRGGKNCDEIHVIDRQGNDIQKPISFPSILHTFTISPNGKQMIISFDDPSSNTEKTYIMNINGTEKRLLFDDVTYPSV